MTIRELNKQLRDFSMIKAVRMSGGYVALKNGDETIAAWLTDEEALAVAHKLTMPE
jgi:hypothetical protein